MGSCDARGHPENGESSRTSTAGQSPVTAGADRKNQSSSSPPHGAGMGDRFNDVIGVRRGTGDEPGPRRQPPTIESVRRFAHELLGSTCGFGELRTLAADAGLFAKRGALHMSKDRERLVVLVAARDRPAAPIALFLLDISASGRVTRSVVFRYDSERGGLKGATARRHARVGRGDEAEVSLLGTGDHSCRPSPPGAAPSRDALRRRLQLRERRGPLGLHPHLQLERGARRFGDEPCHFALLDEGSDGGHLFVVGLVRLLLMSVAVEMPRCSATLRRKAELVITRPRPRWRARRSLSESALPT
jgi:hypothetical protein